MLSASTLRSKLQTLNTELGRIGSGARGGVMSGDKPLMSPYDCDKAKVLQEARAFSESPLDPRKCCHIITKILYLLWSGEEPLTTAETSTLFFGVTRLFQSSDDHLRRMIYMLLKELPVASAEAFIVTSSLTKDLTSGSGKHRANAVRVLSRIVDPAMAGQIERYLKTAVVDKNTFVASSALVCGINLFAAAPDVIRRWGNEIQGCIQHHSAASAASSRSARASGGGGFLRKAADTSLAAGSGGTLPAPMVQLHALVLLHRIKAGDPLALQRSLCELVNSFSTSPVAECFLLRYIKSLFEQELEAETAAFTGQRSGTAGGPGGAVSLGSAFLDSQSQQQQRILLDYIESCMRHRHEMVMFEAARTLCELVAEAQQQPIDITTITSSTTANSTLNAILRNFDLSGAITVLQILLSSPKPVIRFAAVREVHSLAQRGLAASVISRCNSEIEPLLNDPNRSTATLAFTTLLKTGQEGSVERLLKQISSFSNDVSDAFRLDIVRAVLQLCLQYPSKYKTLMAFLGSNLREEGSIELKTCAVDALIQIVQQLPQAQELGLLQLCEFIEDCEYPTLCTSILAFLGEQAPTTAIPSRFIRFIYNRLLLENAVVRAAGVDALAKIASRCPNLLPDVLVLLEACLTDNDDEVRDRANLYSTALQQEWRRKHAVESDFSDIAATRRRSAKKTKKKNMKGHHEDRELDSPGFASEKRIHGNLSETNSRSRGEEKSWWKQSLSGDATDHERTRHSREISGKHNNSPSSHASTCDGGKEEDEEEEHEEEEEKEEEEVPSINELLNPEPPVALAALCTALQELSVQPQLQQQQEMCWEGSEHHQGVSQDSLREAEALVERTLAALPSEQQWREQREREEAIVVPHAHQTGSLLPPGSTGGAVGLGRGLRVEDKCVGMGGRTITAGTTGDTHMSRHHHPHHTAGGGTGYTEGEIDNITAAVGRAHGSVGQLKSSSSSTTSSTSTSSSATTATAVAGQQQQHQQRMRIRQLDLLRVFGDLIKEEEIGQLLHSSRGVMLTEKEAEYAVEVIKHFFHKHIIFEFHLRNTVENQVLENIYMKVTTPVSTTVNTGNASSTTTTSSTSTSTERWKVLGEVPAPTLSFNASCACYTLVQRPALAAADLAVLPAVASYIVKEAGDDIGYEDEYPVEHILLGISDYMGTTAVVGKATLFMSPEHGCLLKLIVRSDDAAVARTLLQAFE